MQKDAIEKIQKKLAKSIDDATSADFLFKRFLPTGIQESEPFQKIVDAVTQLTPGSAKKTGAKGKKT